MAESEFRKLSSSGAPFRASEIERGLDGALEDLQPGALPEVGGLIGAKYRVERLIACGGMSAVYAATHNVSGKRVALKWMLPALGQIKGARERFIREACATARIAHPNIVDIYDVGSENGSVYLVMEYLRGETLAQRLARGTLGEQEAITLLLPTLRGVAAAHAHGVIHRDLKPDNIFLCCNEQGEWLEPKVLDFGISKITTDEVRDLGITHAGAVLGTPYYMSPEQVRGAREVDVRTDVYAFGVMLFEALTGRWPFDAETYNELILKIATEPTPRASDCDPNVHPALSAVIERAMARDPDARFPSIESLGFALEPFANGTRFRITRTPVDSAVLSAELPTISREPSPTGISKLDPNGTVPTPPEFAPQRTRGRTMVIAAVALLLCVGGGALMLRTRHAKDASIGRQSSPPTAASTNSPSMAAADARASRAETSVSAAQALFPTANAAESERIAGARAAERNYESGARRVATKSPKRGVAQRDKHGSPDPPPLPEPVATKRLPRDWDDRISVDAPRLPRAADLPAGRIDAQDFR